MRILLILLLSGIAGILGRLGGRAKDGSWYDYLTDSKARDAGCSILTLFAIWLLFGFKLGLWGGYLAIFGLSWGAISLYWDFLFKKDNLWFSGFMVGLACLPLTFIHIAWWLILSRATLLAVIWGLLNTLKYDRILFWRRDVAEEFMRYFSVIFTILIL